MHTQKPILCKTKLELGWSECGNSLIEHVPSGNQWNNTCPNFAKTKSTMQLWFCNRSSTRYSDMAIQVAFYTTHKFINSSAMFAC